jgi:hypothetical protein
MTDLVFPPIRVDGAFPDKVLRGFNWTTWLPAGYTIDPATAVVVAVPADLGVLNAEVSEDGKSVNFLVTGGTPGTDYVVGCTIQTVTGGGDGPPVETKTASATQTVSDNVL